MNCPELLQQIEEHCEGLTFVSETDAEVHGFQAPNTIRGALTKANFLKVLGLSPLTTIDERDFNAVLNGQINMDESGAWENLKSLLDGNLTESSVFVLIHGENEAEKDIFAAGIFESHVVGIKTFAVET